MSFDPSEALVVPGIGPSSFDVMVYHPMMASIDDEQALGLAAALVGESIGRTALDTWVDEITFTRELPKPALPLAELAGIVDLMVTMTTDDDGQPRWVVLKGTVNEQPMIATSRQPLRPASQPGASTHVRVDVDYASDDAGLPTVDEMPRLHALELELADAVQGRGAHVASEASGGRYVIHLYVAPEAADGISTSAGDVRCVDDPSWQRVAHLRG